jgi:cytochrome c oxidase subunit 2
VTADENYVRESILNPAAKVVAGYRPVMPTYAGQLSEEQVLQLVAFIKSLGKQEQ